MNLLITGAFACTFKEKESLQVLGHDVTLVADECTPLDKQGIDASLFEGVICNGLFLYTPIEKFVSLRYIQLTSAGFDRVPINYIREHGITINNARGVYSVPIAEWVLCGTLQLIKRSRVMWESQQNHLWKKERSVDELSNKIVCIVGAGNIGGHIAKRFNAFDCIVMGIDIEPVDSDLFTCCYSLSRLDETLTKSDIVVLTLPLTDSTRGMFDASRFTIMKPGAIFINVARGALVDEVALISALETGRLGGAVLDVFWEEPLPSSSPLWKCKNVVLTPHNSFIGNGNHERLWNVIRSNIEKFGNEY